MSSKLELTYHRIMKLPTNEAVINDDAVKDNWITTAVKTRGVSPEEAEQRYELERLLFNKTLADRSCAKVTDRFSVYEAAVMLNLSGVTLHEGEGYLIAMGSKLTFQVGWKGRLKQIQDNPNVRFAHQPEVVYDCDVFEYTIQPFKAITKHVRGSRTKDSKLTHVYFVIELKATDRPLVFVMDAIDVYNIRDNRSQSYKQYLKDKPLAEKNNGKITKTRNDGGTYQVDLEVPMWVSDEAQAWRKTIIKHAYNSKLIPQSQMERDINMKIVKINENAGSKEFDVDETPLADYMIIKEDDDDPDSSPLPDDPAPLSPKEDPDAETF